MKIAGDSNMNAYARLVIGHLKIPGESSISGPNAVRIMVMAL